MKYHLENKIFLTEEVQHKGLYPWALKEVDQDDKQINGELIPWEHSVRFTASELRLIYVAEISKEEAPTIDEKMRKTKEKDHIFGILHPGFCDAGGFWEGDVSYSMFGTNRKINQFVIYISKKENDGDNTTCSLWGDVSNTFEMDFHEETVSDFVQISLCLPESQFNKIAELVRARKIDILEINLREVSGFYSEWDMSVSTYKMKVLTNDSKSQEVMMPQGCDINPPRLGDIGEVRVTLIQRHELNPKQDFKSISIDELFNDDDDEANSPEEQEQQDSLSETDPVILSKLTSNEKLLKYLLMPLWIIVILLAIKLVF